MGVNLGELAVSKEIELADLFGKKIGIDAFNTLYQFISIIRDRLTGEPLRDSKGRVTSHLSGLFYRTARLLEEGITPVYVFDGKPPKFKQATVASRIKVRESAEKRWKDALKKKDYETARIAAQGASRLTSEMVEEAKKLLDAMGVGWVQAPSEGEAQAAFMVKKGLVWSTGSQDWDSLLFDTPKLVRNLTVSGKRKIPRKKEYIEVKPEMVETGKVREKLGINQEQLISLGILVGTDYNIGGVKGIGPKTALKIVKEKKTFEKIFREIQWDFSTTAEEIYNFFENPPVEEIRPKIGKLDIEKTRAILEDHDFSEERIKNTLKKLSSGLEKTKQQGLAGFLK